MFFYICIILLFFLFVVFIKIQIVKRVLCFCILAFPPAFRKDIGGIDYFIYQSSYIKDEYKFEPAYNFAMMCGKWIGINFDLFLCIITLMSFLLLFNSVLKHTEYLFFALLIYIAKLYIFYDFVLVRQMIAIPFVWLALSKLRDKNNYQYAIYLLVASLFHYSAILLFPLCFFIHSRFNNKCIIVILILSLIAKEFVVYLLDLISNLIPYIGYRLNDYLDKNNSVNIFNFAEQGILLLILMKYRKIFEKKNIQFNFYFNLFLISIVLLITFSSLEDIKRLKDYFILSYFILLPATLSLFRTKNEKIIVWGMLVIYFTILYIRSCILFSSTAGTGELYPYKSILDSYF